MARNTQLWFIQGVPWDNSYSDVRRFATQDSQLAYLQGKRKFLDTNSTYQRNDRSIYSQRTPEQLYDCNYIAFRNDSYGDKWIFGWITGLSYVNDKLTKVSFEIDYWQTWQFELKYYACYVEREHTNDDSLFSNLLPEPVSTGDYIAYGGNVDYNFTDYRICIAVSTTPERNSVPGAMVDNIFTGMQINEFSTAAAANAFIASYVDDGRLESIVQIFMSPYNTTTSWPDVDLPFNIPNNINGYVPVNNKLFSYPFSFIRASNKSGDYVDYFHEDFIYNGSRSTPNFKITRLSGMMPMIYMYPEDYNGIAYNYDEGIQIGDFPICGWSGDVYANWLAQNSASQNFKTLKNAGLIVGGAVTGNIGLVAAGTVGAINQGIERDQKSRNAGQPQASPANPSFLFKNNKVGYQINHYGVHANTARAADEFFTAYGYNTSRNKIPNITGRASFNYVKTRNIILMGNVPTDAMSRIKQAFNSGIRIWHIDAVGNLAAPNQITMEDAENE